MTAILVFIMKHFIMVNFVVTIGHQFATFIFFQKYQQNHHHYQCSIQLCLYMTLSTHSYSKHFQTLFNRIIMKLSINFLELLIQTRIARIIRIGL